MVKKYYGFSFRFLLLRLSLVCVFFSFSNSTSAGNDYSIANADFNTAGTWSSASCGGVSCGCTPSTTDNITICAGYYVTSAAALTLGNGGTITIGVGATLDFGNNAVTLGNGATLIITGGTLICGPLTFNNGSAVNEDAAGSIIVNGDFQNKNNSSGIVINGYMSVSGNATFGNGSTVTGTGGIQVAGTASGAGTVFGNATPGTGISGVSLSTGGSVLPVEFVSFIVSPSFQSVDLSWTTASETNNDYFSVERSSDAQNYTLLNKLKGAGNYSSTSHYAFKDEQAPIGTVYYRLSQTDYNGNKHFLAVRAVQVQTDFSFNIYPNPSLGNVPTQMTFNSEKESGQVLVVVYDISGNEMFTKITPTSKGKNNLVVVDDTTQLPKGIYIITASSDNSIYKQKFIIQ